MTDGPRRAVIYTRVSRDDTGEGKSNQRQEEDCRKLADLRGWQIVAVEEDISISAYSGKQRPGWGRVLERVERGDVDVVIAWHLDRMTRSMVDLEQLIVLAEEHGVGVATVTGDIDLTSDVGRMVARILAAVARAEVERKGARQKRANQQRAAEGIPWRTGFRAFGYELDGTVRTEEAELIRTASDSVLSGKTLRAVTRAWNETPYRTGRQAKKGGDWSHRSVRAVLLNPRNAGIATYKGEPIGKGAWESIITEETHTLLVAELTDPGRNTRPGKGGGRKPRNLLSGIARCATCGDTVHAAGSKQGPTYQCASYHVATSREDADNIVRASIRSALLTVRPGLIFPVAPSGSDAADWEEAEKLRERLNVASDAYAKGTLTIEQLTTASASINAQLAQVEARLAASPADPATLSEHRRAALLRFASLDLDEARDLLANMAEITLYPKGKGNKRGAVGIKQQVTVFLRVPVTAESRSGLKSLEEAITKSGPNNDLERGYRLMPVLDERTD